MVAAFQAVFVGRKIIGRAKQHPHLSNAGINFAGAIINCDFVAGCHAIDGNRVEI